MTESGDIIDEKNEGIQNPSFEEDYEESVEDARKQSSIKRAELAQFTEELTYSWRNLNVWTPGADPKSEDDDPERGCCKRSKKTSKHILKNLTGFVRPGELLAIMGASGSGKSTLLNVLNFRHTGNLRVSGERTVNGVPVGPDSLTSVSAYIQQEDLFIGSLTVREHLVFQALVRMHSHIPYKIRIQRVDEVIQELGLSKCAGTKIGTPGRMKGISGGEMKRLSFASEVLTDPPLMFCDEPTSGLDSFMSVNITSLLKNLAAQGKTILCIIHQPSSQIFQMFDRVLLLAEGRMAFMGQSKDAITFFRENGYACPENYNPADFYIQTLAIQPGLEEECKKSVFGICDTFESSDYGKEIEEISRNQSRDAKVAAFLENETKVKFKSPYKASWIAQFRAVFWRAWTANIKNPAFIQMRLAQTTILSLIVGAIFFGQKRDLEGIQNINGAIFMLFMNLAFGNTFSTIDVFCLELPIFLREHFNGMYRTDVYFLSKMAAEAPFYIFFPFLAVCIAYFMIGLLNTVEAFFITAGIFILVANCSVSVGYFVSCIAPTVSLALGIAPALLVPVVLFGGFFLNAASVPVYLIWLKYISWFYYGNEALVVTQWQDIDSISCSTERNSTCPANGGVVIANLGFNEENFTLDIFAMVGLVIAFRILAFVALLAKTYRK